MSANPAAFDFLRHRAYAFARTNGKDRERLLEYCQATLAEEGWQVTSRSGLSNAELRALSNSVTDWVIRKYNPPRGKPKPRSSRQTRAATVAMASGYSEMLEGMGEKPTVRNATFILGLSKSTVARHLRANGISPRRDNKIEKLPAKERQLVRILDATFPNDGAGLLKFDDLGYALYDGVELRGSHTVPEHVKSTLSTRRKRLKSYVQSVEAARIGYHFMVSNDVVAVRRGRRFKSFKDALIWIEDERNIHGVTTVRLPKVESGLFWEDRWVRNVMGVYTLLLNVHIDRTSWLEPLIDIMRLRGDMLMDPTPVYNCAAAAIAYTGVSNDDFPGLLDKFADKVFDKDAADATHRLATFLWNANEIRHDASTPEEVFADFDYLLDFEEALRSHFPESHARVAYLKTVIAAQVECKLDFWSYCQRCKELERRGDWKPPSNDDLSKLMDAA